MPTTPLDPGAASSRTLLSEHAAAWLAAVAQRRSRRKFDRGRVDPGTLQPLAHLCEEWRPHADCRTELVASPSVDVFTGVLGGYGKVVGAPHLLVFVGDQRSEFVDQHIGYCGEAVILEATRLGLATCWVGGFFSAKRVAKLVKVGHDERVFAVSPVGYAPVAASSTERAMAGLAGAHKRKSVAELAPTSSDAWPAWAVAAVETARLAPSAVNRQPWRFHFQEGGLVVAQDRSIGTPKVAKRLDVGIAMLHVELAALAHGVDGAWTDLRGSDVARFDPAQSAAR
jgi:nitroreductase